MELLQVAAGVLLLLALAAMVVVWALWKRSRGAAARLIANAEKEAKRIVVKGEIEGQRIQKDVEIVARERLLAARTEFERETRDLRVELSGLAGRLEEHKGRRIDKWRVAGGDRVTHGPQDYEAHGHEQGHASSYDDGPQEPPAGGHEGADHEQ